MLSKLVSLTTLALLTVLEATASARTVHITNSCPTEITVYINGVPQTSLPAGHTTDRQYTKDQGLVFYTDANGSIMTNGAFSTQAGIQAGADNYYIQYYMWFINTGVSIGPTNPVANCSLLDCRQLGCSAGDLSVPKVIGVPPSQACSSTQDVEYTVTFCPGGSFPAAQHPVSLHPNGNTDRCLRIKDNDFVTNGQPVEIGDCTPGNLWYVSPGATQIRHATHNKCLDASSVSGNGVGMKVWDCYDNLPAQQWYYTSDNRVALAGQGQCLDLPSGNTTTGTQVQTWQCNDGNINQAWVAEPITWL